MADAPRIFISYARSDSTLFVGRLEQDLKAQKFHPWVDRHGLEGGDEWLEMIQEAIDQCHALVAVLSPAAVQSKFVRMEYRYAANHSKLVIPAMYLPTTKTHIDLEILHWVDFHSSYEEGLRQLVLALSRLKVSASSPPAERQPQSAPAQLISSKTKEQWLNEGHAHRTARRYDEALAAYNQGIQINPQDADA